MFRMKLYPSSLLTITLYVCSHGMSYPISGLVKSYKAKQYDVEHPLVVGHCKSYNFLRETKDMCWPKRLLYDILSYLRVKPAIWNFLQMTTAQDVETSVTVNNNSPIQGYIHPDDQTQPTHEMTPGFKPFTSDRSRGGARGARPSPPPLIFRPNWGPKGRKNFFWRPSPPLSQNLNYHPPPTPLPLIWRYGSAIVHSICVFVY